MAAIRFATTAESADSMTLTFARNPSFPRDAPIAGPATLTYLSADGTAYRQQLGTLRDLELQWPPAGPMSDDDFSSLRTFVLYVRGTQDRFTYRDEDGVDHDAWLTSPDLLRSFTQHPHGFAGKLSIRIRT